MKKLREGQVELLSCPNLKWDSWNIFDPLISINQWIKCYLIQVADITLTSYSLVMSSATWRPAPASTPPHPKQRRPFETISGKSISCWAQLVWRICSRTTKKDDFSMPVNNCRAGNRIHTWKRWIQVKICWSSSVLCDLSKWQHLFRSNSKLFKVIWSLSK